MEAVPSLWLAKSPCTLDTRGDIVTRSETLFQKLGADLLSRGVTGEIAIAGGAVILLLVESRDTTKDWMPTSGATHTSSEKRPRGLPCGMGFHLTG